jgi:putative transposase
MLWQVAANSLLSRQRRRKKRVKAVFQRHSGRYASRSITAQLCAEGESIGRFQIRAARGAAENLRAIQPRRFVPRAADSTHGKPASPNL